MKNMYKITSIVLFVLLITMGISAQNEFITTWKTDNTGTSNSTSITIPTNSSYSYSYDVDWDNDGTFDDLEVIGDITHDYGTAGEYQVTIRGIFPSIYFNNGGDKLKLININQWGTISWETMEAAFYGCSNMVSTATDVPDLSGVTNMAYTFSYCSSFNSNISAWDVSKVTTMKGLFKQAVFFNQDISSWDMSSVTDLSEMFYGNFSFNKNISSWNVSNVTTMESMFNQAYGFNQNISNWDVSQVTTTKKMFSSAYSFNQDISTWQVGKVTSFSNMFSSALKFDQNLGAWDISSLTDATNMFNGISLSTENYDALLLGWGSQTVKSNVTFNAGNSVYCQSGAYHTILAIDNGWIIGDGGAEDNAPIPDEDTLSDIESECELTSLTAPTATDCTGTITGTHTITLPVTAQGTTVVTWTYEDANGNISTQNQNIVIIKDVTKPTIICMADETVAKSNGIGYVVLGTEFDPTNYSDNCGVAGITNDFNGKASLADEELPMGDNVITWTVSDEVGNTATCSYTITVSTATHAGHISANNGFTLFPNPTNGIITVEFGASTSYTLSILSSTGAIIEKHSINENSSTLDLSHLKDGIYLVRVVANHKTYTTKLIKK